MQRRDPAVPRKTAVVLWLVLKVYCFLCVYCSNCPVPPTFLWDSECLFDYVWARNSWKKRSKEWALNYNYCYLLLLVPNTSDDIYTVLVNQTNVGKRLILNSCCKAEMFIPSRIIQGRSKVCQESVHSQYVPVYPKSNLTKERCKAICHQYKLPSFI